MKKRYFLVPLICIAVLVAIIVSVALVMNKQFFKRTSYDHISENSYNGVEIIGEDGLFYLYKDEKKVSRGFTYLKSVNDLYTEQVLNSLATKSTPVVLFDYYIASSADDPMRCMLITSTGEEYIIAGEGYTLDISASRLPYLVYTSNKNGLVGVVSLLRPDSDLSSKTGNELELRLFSDASVKTLNSTDIIGKYLVTDDIAPINGEDSHSYFRDDGTKLTSGAEIELITLSRKHEQDKHLYFYNKADKNIVSLTGELIASNIYELVMVNNAWGYARCINPEGDTKYIEVFNPDKHFSLKEDAYELNSLWTADGDAFILKASDASGFDVISAKTEKATRYKNILVANGIVRADNSDGEYYYLDSDGTPLMKSSDADMMLNTDLSTDTCYVLHRPLSLGKLYFARAGAEPFIFDVPIGVTVEKLENSYIYDAYRLTRLDGIDIEYSLLSPFSAVKQSEYYDFIECSFNDPVAWIKATSKERSAIDIIDPLTLNTVTGFRATPEDFDDYKLKLVDGFTLYTDERNTSSDIQIKILALSNTGTDLLKNNVRYFALYRPAYASNFDAFSTSALQIKDFDANLLLDEPIVSMGDKYLITYSASGSRVYTFDSNLELMNSASIPYPIVSLIEDNATGEDYFAVRSSFEDDAMRGVYNTSGLCLVSPYYEYIGTDAYDGCFVARLGGAYGTLKAELEDTPKKFIDFKWSGISYLCDDAFIAFENSNTVHIYSGRNTVLSGVAASITELNYYSVADDGTLSLEHGAIVRIDGEAYIHK